MRILDYFKPVSSWPAEKVRQFLKDKSPQEYNLVDVRQAKEYEGGHLPGAQLIPVGELEGRLKELDPNKPTIAYWAAGVRSRAAAAILSRAGFKEVYSMEGGIQAWKGFVSKGIPEAGMTYFSPAHRPEEFIGLAWLLEDGSKKFYSKIAEILEEQEAANLFRRLSADEESHKGSLFKIYQEVSGLNSDPGFPGSVVAIEAGEDYMEGGLRLSKALEWAREEKLSGILELSISLEANSHDLYIKMEREVEDKKGKNVFKTLAEMEKEHLNRLSSLFERNLEEAEK